MLARGLQRRPRGAGKSKFAAAGVPGPFQTKEGGNERDGDRKESAVTFSVMHLRYIVAGVYLAFGLLQYSSIGGVGAALEGKKAPSLWRKVLVILLWPLAMIGAIEG